MQGKIAAFVIGEKSHPFPGSVGMAVNQMGRAGENDALGLQVGMGGLNIGNPEIKDIGRVTRAGFTQHQAGGAKVKEDQAGKGIKLGQAQKGKEGAGAGQVFATARQLR